jgi:hypothetical protein
MTELITLKDLGSYSESMSVGREEIKQAAIKWIKEGRYFYEHKRSALISSAETNTKYVSECIKKCGIEQEAQENWIINFFNITSEELK